MTTELCAGCGIPGYSNEMNTLSCGHRAVVGCNTPTCLFCAEEDKFERSAAELYNKGVGLITRLAKEAAQKDIDKIKANIARLDSTWIQDEIISRRHIAWNRLTLREPFSNAYAAEVKRLLGDDVDQTISNS